MIAVQRSKLPPQGTPEEPIRAELFSRERLEQHAESLAVAQSVLPGSHRGHRLMPRVQDNGRVLRETCREIANAIREDRSIVPAAEWLVDNFHVVDEQLREIRDDLAPGFYRELPKLADGPFAGHPRVYGIAWAFVAHTDSRFDPELLRSFVLAYQRVQPLTIGELWALAITLRIVLVENLRRLSESIVRGRNSRDDADALADDLLGLSGKAREARGRSRSRLEDANLETAFAVQLVQRLRDQDPAVTPALEWLGQRLTAQGTTPDEMVRVELQRQSSMNVTVRNVIVSMSLMSALDWTVFFESVSLVDGVLRTDRHFAAMDFATRDSYRHAIEELSRGSGRTELEVAQVAIDTAAGISDQDPRLGDPGFYLVGSGRPKLEASLKFRCSLSGRLLRAYLRSATLGYLGTIVVGTGGLLAVPLLVAEAFGAAAGSLAVLGLIAAIPASDLAIAIVNRFVTAVARPKLLPRYELRDGVPSNLRTMVVVPTLLSGEAEIRGQIELLEVHYLANPDGDVRFAILSDWVDAPSESMLDDANLLLAAREGIAALNLRHSKVEGGGDRFLLLHRRRIWNVRERLWMGWERKRGKLHELNRLLRGAADTSFVGTKEPYTVVPPDVRYVLSLDADTRLPRLVVNRLVGTMAHPLNRPRIDPACNRVVEGYGVLQPRVTPPLPGRRGSLFQRISSSQSGIDPYAAAISDVYQDLFGEGSYTGKGIYDVDAFETVLKGRVPENAMLSHDLFEGLHARAGLVTDVELFENVPSHYGIAAARQHRWARGDWQLLPWILRERLPWIGRWKMLDNLRRTLSAPCILLTLLAAWVLPMSVPLVWIAFVLVTMVVPALMTVLDGVIPRRRGISMRSHLRAIARDLRQASQATSLVVTMLAHQAWLMGDAIVRTLYRLVITHRHLLEWTTAARSAAGIDPGLRGFLLRMAGCLALTSSIAVVVALVRAENLSVASPFLLLWAASPALAWWISQPAMPVRAAALTLTEVDELRLVARRTWRYFTTFVGPEDHSLPPDNFQEDPKPVVAHRTSPTNIGLYLLSVVAARDFGWIGMVETVERLEATLESMLRLERFRGHFLNWYDTTDLHALDPRYVSSVDSGNLAGDLIALGQACLEMSACLVPATSTIAGVQDAAHLVRSALSESGDGDDLRPEARSLRDHLDALAIVIDAPVSGGGGPVRLAELDVHARTLESQARRVVDEGRRISPGVEISEDVIVWSVALLATVQSLARDVVASHPPDSLKQRLMKLAQSAEVLAGEMDFRFLFDPVRKLFSIGYRVGEGSLDPGHYDLLASEARLTSFLAIAKGDVPVTHWFRLGRALTPVERDSVLVSWSGSMFEYLMPSLILRAPSGSLLDQTCRLVVRRQRHYGLERDVPWGVSESGYNVRDFNFTYQYSNFGIPGLGLKRGLGDDVVIAPYATALAAMIDPSSALRNFRRLKDAGGRGAYGFYEALDFTPDRLPENARVVVVRAYMAHHQGMSLVALDNVVHDGIMRARFHAEPRIQATELLLQERTPRHVLVARPPAEELMVTGLAREFVPPVVRRFTTPHSVLPRTHLLSNGSYAVMITAAGSGYSVWRDLAVTRWREDVTQDAGGTSIFLRDAATHQTWSVGYLPTGAVPDSYEVVFSEDRARIVRQDGSIRTTFDVLVSPEDDAEVRRVSLLNLGTRSREIEVTSYAEIVLAPAAADAAHSAFSSLFVQTECVPELDALLAMRRPRTADAPRLWMAHVLAVGGETIGELEWETDRARFLGRGRGLRSPAALTGAAPLSGTVGSVLDPIVSLRRRVRILPGAKVRLTFATIVAATREQALHLAEKYRETATFDRAATLAWTRAQVQMHHLGIGPDEAHLFQNLARRVLFLDRTLRPATDVLARDSGGAAALWAHSISGDIPIVLVQIDDADDVGLVRQLLRAHEYWRLKLLAVDLVILNERASSYFQDLQVLLESMVRTSQSASPRERNAVKGGVFILRTDTTTQAARESLFTAARAVLSNRRGTLSEQISREQRLDAPSPSTWRRPLTPLKPQGIPRVIQSLELFNGLGGFAADGREYVTVLHGGQVTPAPWINVVANPTFGFQVSESGSGFTWSGNSRMNRLTPWSNDPVSDPPGEVLYVRDLESGETWCPTALPIPNLRHTHVARHGHGFSRFEHVSRGIALELLQFVPLEDSIKVSRLTLRNDSGRARRLSVTAYVEWVLGSTRSESAPFIVTEIDPATRGMFARNVRNTEFRGHLAFADLLGAQTEWTGDRTEFLGRNGSVESPAALRRNEKLSGRVGAGLDPCGALLTVVELAVGERVDVVFLLGESPSRAEAGALIETYRAADLDAVLRAVTDHWTGVLGGVQVTTPDRAFDVLLNGWLLYQTLACRVWARTATYQSGGAYGFRDQLQDVMALTLAAPRVAREHILRAATRQFPEGDVQHWWHPPSGRGVRTCVSDDAIWLPFAVLEYGNATGDIGVLDEILYYLDGPLLAVEQEDSYFQPGVSPEQGTLFEHCARALDRALAVGSHGLPLIGTGDWNDGMNRVGREGRGESVWLAWFLIATLRGFAPVAKRRGEFQRADAWMAHADAIAAAVEEAAWDGEWYRRAFFDDGTPLGSAANEECLIDSVAQSWSVISGAARPERAARAMASVEKHLIRKPEELILLLTPPFDRAALEPGYLKGYPPGIRENGGQYTHAALWSVMAFAMLGDGEKAHRLFAMLNPIERSRTRAAAEAYAVEPYVVAADVCASEGRVGRGGWTWYTGSAGWMYRAGLEWILGFRLRGEVLHLDPCIPPAWPGFEISFRFRSAHYVLTVENPNHVTRGVASVAVDGASPAKIESVPLSDDGGRHTLRVVLG